MCTFISATINADADLALLEATFERCRRRFEEAPLVPQLPAGRRYLVHSVGHCDCGTEIGSGLAFGRSKVEAGDLEKLRRKGWSEAKIDRWLGQKAEAEVRDRRVGDDRLVNAHQDLGIWVELVRAVLASPTVRVFGLMHDFYAHGPGYDRLPLTVLAPAPVERLTEETLYRLPGGTLAEWRV